MTVRFIRNLHNRHRASRWLDSILQRQATSSIVRFGEKLLELAELALFAVERLDHSQVVHAQESFIYRAGRAREWEDRVHYHHARIGIRSQSWKLVLENRDGGGGGPVMENHS